MRWDLAGSSLRDLPKVEKLVGNAKGDCQEEDRRTCHKIAGGCQSMWDEWRLDRPYHGIRATASKCRWVNCPDGG
ncbi:hypothetical protein GW17_00032640 [Ensete ventricosum]|nr:hypothetical protein GW17_00032640 [Ensete ventricosum]